MQMPAPAASSIRACPIREVVTVVRDCLSVVRSRSPHPVPPKDPALTNGHSRRASSPGANRVIRLAKGLTALGEREGGGTHRPAIKSAS
jgi:hypothetical protein